MTHASTAPPPLPGAGRRFAERIHSYTAPRNAGRMDRSPPYRLRGVYSQEVQPWRGCMSACMGLMQPRCGCCDRRCQPHEDERWLSPSLAFRGAEVHGFAPRITGSAQVGRGKGQGHTRIPDGMRCFRCSLSSLFVGLKFMDSLRESPGQHRWAGERDRVIRAYLTACVAFGVPFPHFSWG